MNTDSARRQMVAQQIRTWDVNDATILDTLSNVRRDHFVPAELVNVAYADSETPLPHGQCMLRPSKVGRILQALDIRPGQEVLEIGTGSGYLSACLANLAGHVTSIDIFDDFIASAQRKLHDAGVENISLDCMDAMQALPEGPFDCITLTSAVPEVHAAYGELLKPGGRLFVIAGASPVQSALLVSRGDDGEFEMEELFETDVPQLISVDQNEIFSF